MQELRWLELLPNQSLDDAIKLLNDLKWNLQVREIEGFLFVNAGHQVLMKTSSRESVEAFLYGMALATCALPKKAIAEFRKYMDEAAGSTEKAD